MIDIGSSILAAIEVLKLAPNVATLLQASGDIIGLVRNMKMDEDNLPPLIGKIVRNEKKRLDDLVDRYYEIDKNKIADEIEKQRARMRIAALICQLLKSIEELREHIEGYDVTRRLFCKSVPDALEAA